MSKLNDKQMRFAKEYVLDLNTTQAAIRAGYSPRTSTVQGTRLLSNANVQKEIAKQMRFRANRTDIKADNVLKEIAKIAFSDIRNAMKWDSDYSASAVPSEEIDDNTAKSIQEITQREVHTREGVNRTMKIKFYDKAKALDMLMKHLNLYREFEEGEENKKNEQMEKLDQQKIVEFLKVSNG